MRDGLRWFVLASASLLALPTAGFASGPCEAGQRVVRDEELARSWKLVVDCRHPEWPAKMVAVAEGAAPLVSVREVRATVVLPALVRAGETVRVWRQDAMVRLETTGVAESSGALGKAVKVRLVRRDSSGQAMEQHVSGVVDGAGSVEMNQ